MPSEYDNVVTAIETLAVENLTLGFVKNRLMDIESRMNDSKTSNKESTSTAFASRPGQKKMKGRITSKGKSSSERNEI